MLWAFVGGTYLCSRIRGNPRWLRPLGEAVSANLSETRVPTCAASRTGSRGSGVVRVDARPTTHADRHPHGHSILLPLLLLESSSIRFESTAISSRRPIILASPLARRETDPRSRAHSPRFELCDTDCTTAQQTTLYTESNAECLLQRSSSSFLSQLSADSFFLLLFFLFGNTCSLLVEAHSGSGEIF